jgi:hypothetical protein
MALFRASVLALLGGLVNALSRPCSEAFNNMLQDTNYKYMNKTFQQWCRVRVENKLAGCCSLVDFAAGKAEGCANKCKVSCEHRPFEHLCNTWFGTACRVTRAPFYSNVSSFEITETFCLPRDCENDDDKSGFLMHYHIYYLLSRYSQWQKDYEHGTLECPSNTEMLILMLAGALLGFLGAVWLLIYLRRPPPQKGATLVEATPGRGKR